MLTNPFTIKSNVTKRKGYITPASSNHFVSYKDEKKHPLPLPQLILNRKIQNAEHASASR